MDGHRFEEIEKFSHMLSEKGIVIPKDLKLAVIVEDRAFRENVPAQHWNTKDLELNTASGHRFYLLREKGAYEQGIDLGGGKEYTSEQVPCLLDIHKVAKELKFEIQTSQAELVQKRYMEIVGDSEEDNWSIVVENILYNLFGKGNNKG